MDLLHEDPVVKHFIQFQYKISFYKAENGLPFDDIASQIYFNYTPVE